MDFFLTSALVRYEVYLLTAGLVYIAFHVLYSWGLFLVRVRAIFGLGKKRNESLTEAPIQNDFGSATEFDPPHVPSVSQDASSIVRAVSATGTSPLPEVPSSDQPLPVESSRPDVVGPAGQPSEKMEEAPPAKELTPEEKQFIVDVIKTVKTRIARGEYAEATGKLIEGLSLDKRHYELNMLLASIYEKEKDYKKAELVFKDLLIDRPEDTELFLKLGFTLSIQGKYEVAFEIYKKLLSIEPSSLEAIEMLANLGYELKRYEESAFYVEAFLKKQPRSVDMLYLLAVDYLELGRRKEALAHLHRLHEIEPYNAKISELMNRIELEVEMQSNFTPQN